MLGLTEALQFHLGFRLRQGKVDESVHWTVWKVNGSERK